MSGTLAPQVILNVHAHCLLCDWMMTQRKRDSDGMMGYFHEENGRNCPNSGKWFRCVAIEEVK